VFVHGAASILVGLLYGVMLPMFPRYPALWAAIVAPLLWTGLLWSSLSVINPLLDERIELASPPVSAYAAGLVRGVTEHAARIDELISEYAEGWTLDRMPAVDRNVLRIGVFELLWAPDVPDGVAISEAVLLAQDLSTDASPAFVNGLLARIAELKPSLQV